MAAACARHNRAMRTSDVAVERGGGGRRFDVGLTQDIALLGRRDDGPGFHRFSHSGSDKTRTWESWYKSRRPSYRTQSCAGARAT